MGDSDRGDVGQEGGSIGEQGRILREHGRERMKVKVLFFASCREIVGEREVEVEVPEGATVADLAAGIGSEHPRFLEMEGNLMISVNQDYAGRDTRLKDGDEVAFIPPVSGGR